MADLSLTAIVHRQLRLLQHVCDTLTMRALAGARTDLESLFLAQEHLEHWLQYLSPLALDVQASGLEAPPPLPGMRPAPSLAPDLPDVQGQAWSQDEAEMRPRVTFPPEPMWVEDLERDQGGEA